LLLLNLIIVCGGRSPEHAVSLKSASSIVQHADRKKYLLTLVHIDLQGKWSVLPVSADDSLQEIMGRLANLRHYSPLEALGHLPCNTLPTVVFPALHGPGGEDGSLQGLFESLDIPYVGSNVSASALGMDKVNMKRIAQALGMPVAPYLCLHYSEYAQAVPSLIRQVEELLRYPCFVKPARGGSSIGISRVGSLGELVPALEQAFSYDQKIVIEREIVGREIELALLGNAAVSCSQPGEFVREPSFFDYQCKYLDKSLAMRIPAAVPARALREMRQHAVTIYREFDCSGLARVDFFLTAAGEVYFNEINTMPGFTVYSMYPSLWAADGMDCAELIDRLINLALERQQAQLTAEQKARGVGND
jgi:D-alanine-D-alanine ligase